MEIVNDIWVSTRDLEDIIAAVRPPGRAPARIEFVCGYSMRGQARTCRANPSVSVVRIWVGPPPGHQPLGTPWDLSIRSIGRAGARKRVWQLRGLDEILAYFIAHELQHIAQPVDLGREWNGAEDDGPRERNADAYAWRALRRWRRAGGARVLLADPLDPPREDQIEIALEP